MLHTRFPLYTYKKRAFATPELQTETTNKSKFYKMYEERRKAFNLLQFCRQLRKQRNYPALIKHTENALSGFFHPISPRVFPRKFEFITELCNNIGLAFCEELQMSQNLMNLDDEQRMFKLFTVPVMSDYSPDTPYQFGDYNTYRDPEKIDTNVIKDKSVFDILSFT